MKKWLVLFLNIIVLAAVVSCVHSKDEKNKNYQAGTDKAALKRYVAEVTDAEPAFWIQSYLAPNILKGRLHGSYVTEKIELSRWKKSDVKNGPGFRGQKLFQMYRANTHATSNKGNRHLACFTGDPRIIQKEFFESSLGYREYRPVGDEPVSVSSDLQMIGISFEALTNQKSGQKVGDQFHFRMSDCVSSGKASILKEEELVESVEFETEGEQTSLRRESNRSPAAAQDGFVINDKINGQAPKNLPRFKLKTDFGSIPKSDPEVERPWFGMNISDPQQAEKFAILLQKYFYEGMYQKRIGKKKIDANHDFVAEKNLRRYWCHMPWLNNGTTGREAIHGLTMERDLAPNPMYPDMKAGSNWGVAYYNGEGCRTIRDVFFDGDQLLEEPEFDEHQFADGSMSVKILFTQANFPSISGAYTWTANVSPPKSTMRSLQPVRHIQMDIGLKDSSLVGTNSGNAHWVMVTYYYDAKYLNKALADQTSEFYLDGLPPELLKMRPQGVQVGFEEKDTILFPGAVTNAVSNDFKKPVPLKHLNGPADNARTNCFGCHGTAGTSVPMVPGVLTNAQYLKVKSSGLDFSQQLALARRNFETAPKFAGGVGAKAIKPATTGAPSDEVREDEP